MKDGMVVLIEGGVGASRGWGGGWVIQATRGGGEVSCEEKKGKVKGRRRGKGETVSSGVRLKGRLFRSLSNPKREDFPHHHRPL